MASVYQRIHAFAIKAQAHHRLQLKGCFHQAATNFAEIYKTTDCSQQRQQEFSNLDVQEPPSLIVPHNHQHSGSGRNASDLNGSTNPIDKTISSLGYSSVPHFLFERHRQFNQQSRKYVMRSEDGWFEDSQVNVWIGPTLPSKPTADHPASQLVPSGRTNSSQALEIDGDTDSSSPAPSTEPDSKAEHYLRKTEDVVGGGDWEERLYEKLSRSHGNEAQPTVPQNIPLKGMARLRRISPRSIETEALQDDPSIAIVIQGDIAET